LVVVFAAAASASAGAVGAATATAVARGLHVDNRVFLGGMLGGGGMTLMSSAESIVLIDRSFIVCRSTFVRLFIVRSFVHRFSFVHRWVVYRLFIVHSFVVCLSFFRGWLLRICVVVVIPVAKSLINCSFINRLFIY
jgi:hypothetical protein